MSDLPRSVHMLGICGTAMTALAGSLQAQTLIRAGFTVPHPPRRAIAGSPALAPALPRAAAGARLRFVGPASSATATPA